MVRFLSLSLPPFLSLQSYLGQKYLKYVNQVDKSPTRAMNESISHFMVVDDLSAAIIRVDYSMNTPNQQGSPLCFACKGL